MDALHSSVPCRSLHSVCDSSTGALLPRALLQLRPVPLALTVRSSRGGMTTCRSAADQIGYSSAQDMYREADVDAAGESFRAAYRQSARMPEGFSDGLAIDGMQQFASAIWDRNRNIPSSSNSNGVLGRIFDSFDTDGDGHLSAKEVAAALRSRNVELTEAIAQKFIEASDADNTSTVEKDEFAALVLHMASADLRSKEIAEYWARKECTDTDCKI